MDKKFLQEVEDNFYIQKIESVEPVTTGNINSTFRVEAKGENYTIQQINSHVFDEEIVMKNINGVTDYLRKRLILEGRNPNRYMLNPVETVDGTRRLIDQNGNYWRMFYWIEGAKTYDSIEEAEKQDNISGRDLLYQCGKAIGKFHKDLANYPIGDLREAIPGFHNTLNRYADFELAVETDKSGRLKAIEHDQDHPLNIAIAEIKKRKRDIALLEVGRNHGKLPVRVTHNDPKINNIMIDVRTKKAICMIDLDTIGPGLSAHDYADAVRSGTNRAGEEKSIEEAVIDKDLFEAFTRGYLEETLVIEENGKLNNDPKIGLTKEEVAILHKAPKILTLELAMRFIGDYLNGDEYFKVKQGQSKDINLKRGLIQLHLAKDMEDKEPEMEQIVRMIVNSIVRDGVKRGSKNKVNGVEPNDGEPR